MNIYYKHIEITQHHVLENELFKKQEHLLYLN